MRYWLKRVKIVFRGGNMDKCEYKMSILDGEKLCGYYIENVKIKDRPYAHYPKCHGEGCPLVDKNKKG